MNIKQSILLLAAIGAVAGAPLARSAEAEPSPRSAGDMSIDERRELMSATNAYQRCVYDAAMANIEASDDVRRVADLAFEKCGEKMEALAAWFDERDFDPAFARGYSEHMQNRAGRRLLPELMMRKSGG